LVHLYADDSLDDGKDGSGVRFADVTAPPHWADRINDLVTSVANKSTS
jgi:hypothetical protein